MVDGERRLIMGRVEQGAVVAGQRLTVFPGGTSVEVTAVLKQGETISSAGEGECVALLLSKQDFERGQVLTDEAAPRAPRFAMVNVFWAAADPLRVGDEITGHCRTQVAPFVVDGVTDELETAGPSELRTGDVGQIRLRLKAPMLLEAEAEGAALSRLVFHKNGQVAGCGVVAHVE